MVVRLAQLQSYLVELKSNASGRSTRVMGTFIVSDILGGRQVVLVGNLIQNQFLSARDPTFGSAASILLMVLTLVVTLFYARRFGFGEEVVY